MRPKAKVPKSGSSATNSITTGAHKINNCIGQILLAMRMGKTRIIAETGRRPARRRHRHGLRAFRPALRHLYGRARYRAAAAQCVPHEAARAEVRAVTSGAMTLKDAMNEGLRDWVANVHDTFYIIGPPRPPPLSRAGPRFPERDRQGSPRADLPASTACPICWWRRYGGGSNALGLFHPFLDDRASRWLGVESGRPWPPTAARREPARVDRRCAPRQQDLSAPGEDGQIAEAHSISAGLDYPGIGPEHSWLHSIGRVEYTSATDTEALDAFQLLCAPRGSSRARPSHAIAARRPRRARNGREQIHLCTSADGGPRTTHA